MARDLDEMEDDNPIPEDFEGNEGNEGNEECDFCEFCGKKISMLDDFCSDECENKYKEEYLK